MAIEIKLLNPQDTGVLANIAPEVFDNPIEAGRADEFLADPRHHLAVAVEDGWVVGFVSAVHYVHPDKPRPELSATPSSLMPRRQVSWCVRTPCGATTFFFSHVKVNPMTKMPFLRALLACLLSAIAAGPLAAQHKGNEAPAWIRSAKSGP
jgi:hypothetical protein